MSWTRFFRRATWDAERSHELDSYLQIETDENIAKGMTPEEARAAAHRKLGNCTRIREEIYRMNTVTVLDALGREIRYAVRAMRRNRSLTGIAILTLALGIGANTGVFSILHALLLDTLPVHRPRELVSLVEEAPVTSRSVQVFPYPVYDQLRRGSRLLSLTMATVYPAGRPGQIMERGEEHPAFVQMVSDNYFDMLGVTASRGRLFDTAMPPSPDEAVAVISDRFWQNHYGGDPAALGARFRTFNRDFTVIGIAAPEFRGLEIDSPTDIWVPFEQTIPLNDGTRLRGRLLRVMGRLQPGATIERAEAEANGIFGRAVQLRYAATGYSNLRERLTRPLLLLELVALLVLLLACANLANLSLADIAAREREFAVRRAIGASRLRIAGQEFARGLLVSITGGALALITAYWISGAFLSFLPPDQAPALANLRFELDARIFAFAALLSLGTPVLFALIPGLAAIRPPSRYQRQSWISRGLVICGVSMCAFLLIVAGLFVRTVQNLRWQDTGYQENGLLVADIAFPRQYGEARRDELIEALRERAAGMPGVEVAAFSHIGQLSGFGVDYYIRTLDGAIKEVSYEGRMSPGFMKAMGTPLLAGRDFIDADNERSALVAIVNESFVRRFRLDENTVGRHFVREGGSTGVVTIEVVGVVVDSKWVNLRDESPAMYFVPYRQQSGSPTVRFAIRASGNPNALGARILEAARALDSQIRLSNVVPFDQIVNRTLMTERLVAQVSGAFSVLALLIAAVGLHGLLAYAVVRRRKEIGIRMAVGAPPRSVEWMFLRESLVLAGIGCAIGVPAAIGVSRLVSSMLFGLTPQDPITITATVISLIGVTAGAAYLPARRAAGTDPLCALREE